MKIVYMVNRVYKICWCFIRKIDYPLFTYFLQYLQITSIERSELHHPWKHL